MKPLTIAITGAHYTEDSILLRMMLNSLSKQSCKDFDVIFVDHFYDFRKDLVKQLGEHYNLDLKHCQYLPHPKTSKKYMDCNVFNWGFILSDSMRVMRLSEHRFLRPDAVEKTLDCRNNVDYYYHDLAEHSPNIWDYKGDEVEWSRVPHFSQPEVRDIPFPRNSYGNITIWREQWLTMNGFDGDCFGHYHWEDQAYSVRMEKHGYLCDRIPNLMFRIYHTYGAHMQRANVPLKYPPPKLCDKCNDVQKRAYGLSDGKGPTNEQWTIAYRETGMASEWQAGIEYLVCPRCNFIQPVCNSEDIQGDLVRNYDYREVPIGIGGVGRNWKKINEDMQGKIFDQRVEILNNSWSNPRYLEKQ